MDKTSEPVLILAIDTTTEHGSLALAHGAELCECREVYAQQSYSRVLFDEINMLLERNGAAIADVVLYAVAAGPGSFTGVRVGLTAAKGLAVVHRRMIAPVSNLAATAWQAPPGPRFLVPVLDAHRGEVYATAYERSLDSGGAGELKALMPELVARPAALEERLEGLNLPPAETAFCGPDMDRLPLARFQKLETPRALAPAVAALGWRMWNEGEAVEPSEADANYVRRSDAEIFSRPWGAKQPGERQR